MKKNFLLCFCIAFSFANSLAYDGDEIMEIKGAKRSIYRDSGIFHNGIKEHRNTLNSLRHSGKYVDSYERLVLDFKRSEIPQVYAHLDPKNNRLQIDFLRTGLSKKLKPLFKSHRVKEINFFPLANDVLSTEFILKKNTYVEIFFLKKPSRLVIDLKN